MKEGPAVAVGPLQSLPGAPALPSLAIPGAILILSILSPISTGPLSPLRSCQLGPGAQGMLEKKKILIFPLILGGVWDLQLRPGLSKYFDCTRVRT